MKEIIVSKKWIALIDDEDFEKVSKKNWFISSNRLYARCNDNGKSVTMHRYILGLTNPKDHTDHIDHNGLNNQRSNLRVCTRSQNIRNRNKAPKFSSKYLGVSIMDNGRWQANIGHNKKLKYIGTFEHEWAAAMAYDNMAKKLHGEFANLNFKENGEQV